MNKFLSYFLLGFICLSANLCIAQDDKKKEPLKDRLLFGGSMGLQFGSVTAVQVAPMLGYKVTDRLVAGYGINYQYLDVKSVYEGGPSYTSNSFGHGPFAQFFVLDNLYLTGEFLALNTEYIDPISQEVSRGTIPHLFVGAGYVNQLGGNGYIGIGLKFDLIQDRRSPYYQLPVFTPLLMIGF